MPQKVLSQRQMFLSSQISVQIRNYRLFYFFILTFVLLQAIVIQFDIQSRMFEAFCFFSLGLLFFYCLNKPHIAIMAFTIYIPFSKYIVGNFGTGLNFTNIFVIAIISGWFVSQGYREEKFFVESPVNVPLTLFALVGLMSLIQGSYQLQHFESQNLIIKFWQWFLPFFLYFLAVNNIENRESIKTTIKLIIITTFIVSLMAIRTHMDVGDAGRLEDTRVASIAGNPNSLGVFFINFAPIILGVFVYNTKKFTNYILFGIFLLCSRGIQVTLSRGAWLGYGFATFVVTLIGRSKKLILLGLLSLSIFVVKPGMIPESIRARFEHTFTKKDPFIERPVEETVEKSSAARLIIWGGAVEMIKAQPVFGFGYGTFGYFIMDYCEIDSQRDAHNTYLKIAAERGIPALLIFITLMLTAFYITFDVFRKAQDKFIKGAALGFSGSILGLLATSMFGSRMNSLELIGQFWIMVGLMQRMRMILAKENRQNENEDNDEQEKLQPV